MGSNCRAIPFDDPIKKRLLGLVTLVMVSLWSRADVVFQRVLGNRFASLQCWIYTSHSVRWYWKNRWGFTNKPNNRSLKLLKTPLQLENPKRRHILSLKALFEHIDGYLSIPTNKLFPRTHASLECDVLGCTSAAGAGRAGVADVQPIGWARFLCPRGARGRIRPWYNINQIL